MTPATPATPPPTPPVVTERAKEPHITINSWALLTHGRVMILNAAINASPTGPATEDMINAGMNLLTGSWKTTQSVRVFSEHTDHDEGTESTHPRAATSNSAVGSEFQALKSLQNGLITDHKGLTKLRQQGHCEPKHAWCNGSPPREIS